MKSCVSDLRLWGVKFWAYISTSFLTQLFVSSLCFLLSLATVNLCCIILCCWNMSPMYQLNAWFVPVGQSLVSKFHRFTYCQTGTPSLGWSLLNTKCIFFPGIKRTQEIRQTTWIMKHTTGREDSLSSCIPVEFQAQLYFCIKASQFGRKLHCANLVQCSKIIGSVQWNNIS